MQQLYQSEGKPNKTFYSEINRQQGRTHLEHSAKSAALSAYLSSFLQNNMITNPQKLLKTEQMSQTTKKKRLCKLETFIDHKHDQSKEKAQSLNNITGEIGFKTTCQDSSKMSSILKHQRMIDGAPVKIKFKKFKKFKHNFAINCKPTFETTINQYYENRRLTQVRTKAKTNHSVDSDDTKQIYQPKNLFNRVNKSETKVVNYSNMMITESEEPEVRVSTSKKAKNRSKHHETKSGSPKDALSEQRRKAMVLIAKMAKNDIEEIENFKWEKVKQNTKYQHKFSTERHESDLTSPFETKTRLNRHQQHTPKSSAFK